MWSYLSFKKSQNHYSIASFYECSNCGRQASRLSVHGQLWGRLCLRGLLASASVDAYATAGRGGSSRGKAANDTDRASGRRGPQRLRLWDTASRFGRGLADSELAARLPTWPVMWQNGRTGTFLSRSLTRRWDCGRVRVMRVQQTRLGVPFKLRLSPPDRI
jgi:hypothetical protein